MAPKSRLFSMAFVCFYFILALQFRVYAQCDPGTLQVYLGSFAVRNTGNQITLSSNTYAAGADAEYTSLTTAQTDYLNQQQIGQTINGSANPGGVADTYRIVVLTATNSGQFQTNAYHTATDNCTGRHYPPFDNGFNPNTGSAIAARPLQISGNSGVFVNQYDPSGTTTPIYARQTTLTAETGGVAGVPHWTLGGGNNPSELFLTCTDCPSTTVALSPNAVGSCSTAGLVQFTISGFASPQVGIIVKDGHQIVGYNDITGLHVSNSAQTRGNHAGYVSTWQWQDVDSCNGTMQAAGGIETFPQGFTNDQARQGWAFPTPTQWVTDSSGGWYDSIGETCTGVPSPTLPTPISCDPKSTGPQNPLANFLMYHGTQNVYLGSDAGTYKRKLAFTGSQAHYTDHGGYLSQTLEP